MAIMKRVFLHQFHLEYVKYIYTFRCGLIRFVLPSRAHTPKMKEARALPAPYTICVFSFLISVI